MSLLAVEKHTEGTNDIGHSKDLLALQAEMT